MDNFHDAERSTCPGHFDIQQKVASVPRSNLSTFAVACCGSLETTVVEYWDSWERYLQSCGHQKLKCLGCQHASYHG